MKNFALLLLLAIATLPSFAEDKPVKLTTSELIALAKAHDTKRDDALSNAILANFDESALTAGTAWSGQGEDFFFAIVTSGSASPQLAIDSHALTPMQSIAVFDGKVWFATAHIPEVGKLHSFHYVVDGKDFGGRLDLPAFTPLSYLQPGVPSGKISDTIHHTSKIYDGMKSDYWIYVPAQYDPKTPSALMVFQDGYGYADRKSDHGVLDAIDNLIAAKQIPVMICVFLNPGDIAASADTPTYNYVKAYGDRWHRSLQDSMRSTLYDTVSDRYDRYLRDEILTDVGAKYKLRKDAYSRGITGLSSGGICAFNAAWQMPDQFSRVLSWIGSFTSIQMPDRAELPGQEAGVTEGGQDYPDKILREPHRNLRVWLQDGANDMENPNYGSWPLANIRMANALKSKGYDFHFSFGHGTHNPAHGAAEFPESMIWLWRGYDPAKTGEVFQIDPAEKALPPFRVAIVNRPAD